MRVCLQISISFPQRYSLSLSVCVFFVVFISFSDMSQSENDDDDLDFYDFLEAVSDKIDDITQQSRADLSRREWPFHDSLVEERKEDSRQRWQRTREEVEEQKRQLKSQLQKKIRVWSDNLKTPNFIRTRDKIAFSIGVANTCFSPLVGRESDLSFPSSLNWSRRLAGRYPHLLPLIYTIQALLLIPLRFFIYKRKSWHYFGKEIGWRVRVSVGLTLVLVYDLCYFVNLLTLIYLWVFPSSKILFVVCYTLSHGPVGLAIVFWRNSLVFHS